MHGSKETDVREFTVIPWSSPRAAVVTTATPVAKLPIVSRNRVLKGTSMLQFRLGDWFGIA
jgi:hypothetical protein